MKTIKNFDLPSTMRALVLKQFDAKPTVEEVPVPKPGKGEVLVQIDSSPVNPSDTSFIRGAYSTQKKLPVVPGFEASGIVVASGHDFMSARLVGKKVACFAPADGHGTWAQYMCTKSTLAIPLKKNIDIEQGAMMMVNPLSALAMLEIAHKGKHKAIANTAAASALGRMMNRLCQQQKLPIVNIVRRQEQVDLLTSQGAQYVVNTSDKDYLAQMKALFASLHVTIAFDAISGQMSSDLLRALPAGGEVRVYGGLSDQATPVPRELFVFEQKKLSGFWASHWIGQQPMLKLLRMFGKVQKYVGHNSPGVIHKRVSLEETVGGIELYLSNMTAGKILVKPWK